MRIHQPRLTWDGARAFVTASATDAHFVWLSEQVRGVLGPAHQRALADTRRRLQRPSRQDARQVEAGTWRARLEETLQQQPELAEPLRRLVAEAFARGTRHRPQWPIN
ncbi:MAG TPA: hypothetical protein VES42_15940 [Pilimelia sp.]|nr:hypothetical protein [Pilimelia sp.]